MRYRKFDDANSDGALNDPETLVEMIREMILTNYALREKAYRNLLRFIEPFGTHESALEEDGLGICPLETIMSIPSHLYDKATVLSQRLILAYTIASAKIHGRPVNGLALNENCVICGSTIAFEDLFEARCNGENVHRFGMYHVVALKSLGMESV